MTDNMSGLAQFALFALIFAGAITGLETFNTIRNYKLYKKAAAFQATLKK